VQNWSNDTISVHTKYIDQGDNSLTVLVVIVDGKLVLHDYVCEDTFENLRKKDGYEIVHVDGKTYITHSGKTIYTLSNDLQFGNVDDDLSGLCYASTLWKTGNILVMLTYGASILCVLKVDEPTPDTKEG